MNNRCSLPMAIALLMGTYFLTGCVSSGTKVTATDLSHFKNGVTTLADVEKTLGPPQSRTLLADGHQQIIYVGIHAQAKAVSFIPVVGLFAGGATGQTNVVTFFFDPRGVLQDYSSTESNSDVRTGMSAGTQADRSTHP